MNECLSQAARHPAAAVAPPRWIDWRGSGCILVIEDDDAIRAVVTRTVSKLGFTSNQASDGPKAIAQFAADPGLYALVLLDFMLPGMDGRQILARLQQLRPDIRVILMSGLSRQEATSHLDGQSLAGFLQKPFSLEALATELRAAIEA
jgi:two-component system cell cycle sensor histidine kinase/response regulator CckA